MHDLNLDYIPIQILVCLPARVSFRIRIRIRINFYTALTAIIKKIFIFKKLLVDVQDETSQC